MSAASLVEVERQQDLAIVSINNPPVNQLSFEVFSLLDKTFRELIPDDSVKGIVVVGKGKNFSAGFDISSVTGAPDPKNVREGISKTDRMLEYLEDSPKPVVAAIAGNCLGGGCELALGCHYRIADKTTTIGLPEVMIGLIPGAGGTQRLPRLAGPIDGATMIAEGKTIPAQRALELEIIDQLVEPGQALATAIELCRSKIGQNSHPKAREKADKVPPVEMLDMIVQGAGAKLAKVHPNIKGPRAAIRAIDAGLRHGYEKGIETELEEFVQIMFSPEAAASIHFFFASRGTSKIPDLKDAGGEAKSVSKVGVVGGGTMGRDIAFIHLLAGKKVALLEAEEGRLKAASDAIQGYFARRVEKGMSQADADAQFALLQPTLDYADFADCDIVIEAVFEKMEVKKDVFTKLNAVVSPNCFLASNTSTLPIAELASVISDPTRMIGLHYFSPARAMPLLEMIRTSQTSPTTILTALQLAKETKKTPVLVRDCYGFLTNRIAFSYGSEANALLEEGASIQQIDEAMVEFGFPMGPFTMSDMAGNDIAYHAMPGMVKAYPARARNLSKLGQLLFEAGRHGQKAGKGFYDYPESGKAVPSPEVESMLQEARKAAGITPRTDITKEEIIERIVYHAWVNIAGDCLDDGTAIRPDDVDVATVFGFGFPPWRGGAMYFAKSTGYGKILAALEKYAAKYGKVYEPSSWVRNQAKG